MQFYHISIRNCFSNGLLASIYHDLIERDNVDNGPHSSGFYYCPVTKSPEEGFNQLRDFLIKKAENSIKELQDLIDNLRNLPVPPISMLPIEDDEEDD